MSVGLMGTDGDWVWTLMEPAMWTLLAVLVACLLVAWFAYRRYGAWRDGYLRSGDRSRVALTALKGARLLVFPLVACFLLLAAWGAFAALQQPAGLLRVALSLAVAFALVRLVVYLLSNALRPGPLLLAFEGAIVAVIWLGLALHLLGWLPLVMDALDAAAIKIGSA